MAPNNDNDGAPAAAPTPAATAPTPAPTAPSAALFADDDEETLALLLAGSASNSSLQALAQRFLEDHTASTTTQGGAKLFDAIVRDVPGFVALSSGSYYQHHAPPAGSTPPSSQEIPASLKSSEAGKLHLKAVQEALHVSETAALQLTLGVLLKQSSGTTTTTTTESDRNSNSNDDSNRNSSNSIQWSQLIGTRSLLIQTCEYYFQQRVARLAAVAELLRSSDDEAAALLDPLDGVTTSANNKNQRGLFRILLTAACQPEAVVQRQDFLAAQKLTLAASPTKSTISETDREDRAWKQMIATVLERQRCFQQRERLEALEALLVLLYERVPVQRTDLAVLLTAFQRLKFYKNNSMTTTTTSRRRLSCLAGLICVESMALWRIFSTSDDEEDAENNPSNKHNATPGDWKNKHPLLQGLFDDPAAGEELLALETLFRSIICNVDERQQLYQESNNDEAPESLILLAFGLLAHAAGATASESSSNMETDGDDNDVSKVLRSTGMELAKLANGKYDAFGYLRATMKYMVVPPATTVHPPLREMLPYDLLAFHGKDQTENPIQLVDSSSETENELSATSLAYASIGREVLNASIQAFRRMILPTLKIALPENVNQLSSLVVVTFRNSPFLCWRFWTSWEEYTLDQQEPAPLCLLLKSAHKLATVALQTTRSSDEQVLLSITPLLELVASLVYDAQNMEEVLAAIVPANLILRAVSILSSRSGSMVSPEFTDCRKRVLHSLSTLAKVGDSDQCRGLLRAALEESLTINNNSNKSVQASRLLTNVVTKSRDPVEVTQVFGVLASLVKGAPFEWMFDSVRALHLVQDDSNVWRGLFEEKESCTQATVQLMSGLIDHLNKVIFSSELDEAVAVEILSVIKRGVWSASELLPAFLSTLSPPDQAGRSPLTYSTASLIMDMLNTLLLQLRFMIEMHKSERVSTTASEFLDALIGALAAGAGLGESVCFFATAPVSLSIYASLVATLQDPSILQAMAGDDNADSVFTSFRQSDQEGYVDRVTSLLAKKLADVDSISLDQNLVDGNFDVEEGRLRASLSALRLFNGWANCVESKLPQVSHDSSLSSGFDFSGFLAVSPARVLFAPSILPPDVRSNAILSSAWAKARVSTYDLILWYFVDKDSSIVETVLAGEAFDILSTCLHHGRIATCGSPLIFRRITQSPLFGKIMRKQLEHTQVILVKQQLSSNDKIDISVNLRFLRLLGTVFDAGASVAAKLLFRENDLVKCLVDAVLGVLSDVKNKTGIVDLLVDTALIDRVRIAAGCLGSLRTLWGYAWTPSSHHGSDGGKGTIKSMVEENGTELVRNLAEFVFDLSSKMLTQRNSEADRQASSTRGKCSLLSLLGIAVDVLAVETSWAECRATFDVNALIVRAIENALNGSLDGLVDSTKAFVAMDGFVPYSAAIKCFASDPTVKLVRHQNPSDFSSSLLALASTDSHAVMRGFFSQCNGYDTTFADRWFSSLSESNGAIDRFPSLGREYSIVANELGCFQSWAAFGQMVSQLLKKWRREAPDDRLFTSSPTILSFAMAHGILKGLRQNIALVEAEQVELSATLLQKECLSMTKSSAGLLLSFARVEAIDEITPKEWIEAVGLVSDIVKVVSLSFTFEPSDTMQQMLVSAALISMPSFSTEFLSQFDFGLRSRVENIYVELARTVCGMIKALSWSKLSPEMVLRCLSTGVSFLANIIEKTISVSDYSWQMGFSFSERFGNAFEEFDTMRSLVSHSTSMQQSSADTGRLSPTNSDRYNVMLSILDLFTKIAATGDSHMLGLLFVNDAALALLSHYPDASLDSFDDPSMRGYQENNFAVQSGATGRTDDPAHRVWLASLEFLGACLRSARRNRNGFESESTRISVKATIDFIRENKNPALNCLEQCSSVEFGPYASKQCAFTINLVREAKLILAIVSELCEKGSATMFAQLCPDLSKTLIAKSESVAVSLSTFLGASGASRDIFRALDEADVSDSMAVDQGAHLAALGPVYRLLAGGLQNAKHEAIRYSSHFVLNCTRAMTSKDREAQKIALNDRWKPARHETPGSLSSLEQTCRAGVSNKFAFQIESEAADCLFFALGVLLKTHPASDSFVECSVVEATSFDFMRFVRTGMMIAFRAENPTGLFLPATNTAVDQSTPSETIQYGRVTGSDSFLRKWSVQVLAQNNPSEIRIVNESQLAGIIDPAKRVRMLQCSSAAPDTSSDLEALGKSISVGHLILALRWCSNMSSEESSTSTWKIQRLAEMTCALLGVEMGVQLETRMGQYSDERESHIKLFADSLLDLFGEASEFGSAAAACQREGRLKNVVSEGSWYDARSELHSYITAAVEELNSKLRMEKGRTVEPGTLFVRRSSSSSPFHGF